MSGYPSVRPVSKAQQLVISHIIGIICRTKISLHIDDCVVFSPYNSLIEY